MNRIVDRKMARVLLSGEYLTGGEPLAADIADRGTLVAVSVWPHRINGVSYEWNGSSADPRIVAVDKDGEQYGGGEIISPPVSLTVETVVEVGS